jgi:ABC transporter substrate binding protein
MQALGYREGRDYDTASRFAEGDLTRMPALASELVELKPDIIVTANTTATAAVKKVSSTVPIVSAAMIEPVEKGLVESHAHPGGNLTGILISLDTLLGKRLQIGAELLPMAKKAGMSINMNSIASTIQRRDAEKVASALSMELVAAEVQATNEIEIALRRLVKEGVQVVVVHTDPMFYTERRRMAVLAETLKHSLNSLRASQPEGRDRDEMETICRFFYEIAAARAERAEQRAGAEARPGRLPRDRQAGVIGKRAPRLHASASWRPSWRRSGETGQGAAFCPFCLRTLLRARRTRFDQRPADSVALFGITGDLGTDVEANP